MRERRHNSNPASRGGDGGADGRRAARGFALLMVVTLLAFIVLLLVGLAAYTQIETAVSGNTQRQAQARENALLGLNVALAQLQRYAGPDKRVTATAEAFGYRAGTRRYAGVWPANAGDDDDGDPLTPLTWLVSGNEAVDPESGPSPRDVTPATALNPNNGALLAGPNTARLNNDVLARLMPVNAPGVPGAPTTGSSVIGRYAWWVGDQGVKAPVTLHDRALDTAASASATTTVSYAPYDTIELRRRIRQQLALGAGPAASSGSTVFEPRTTTGSTPRNADMVTNVVAYNQVAFLKNSSGNAIGLTTAQSNFHVWSPDNLAVLANAREGGLRLDLSLRPDLLGSAFAAWSNYPAYMEDPAAPGPLPAQPEITSAEALRRRYRITPSLVDGKISHRVAPVLSLCLLNFDTRTVDGASGVAPVESRLRWVVGLWNPYTSALVPEDLRVEIYGLPQTMEFVPEAGGTPLAAISPRAMFGQPLRLSLPWDAARADLLDSSGNPPADIASWLPGRVYFWASEGNASEPSGGNPGYFYSKSLVRPRQSSLVTRLAVSGDGTPVEVSGSAPGGWQVTTPTQLIVRVFRKDDTEPLATYTSPAFEPFFATDPVADPKALNGDFEFSFLFRLDANPAASWLREGGRDPRGEFLPDAAFVAGPNGPLPSAYPGLPGVSNADWLLDRTMGSTGRSYNEDVPVFELPRSPVLSLGALQHLHFPAARPFLFGNPWGASEEIQTNVAANAVFDRYFFSGLAAPVTAGAEALLGEPLVLPLPNPLLKVLPRKGDGSRTLLRDVLRVSTSVSDPSDGYSARHLLQRGAFNFNSTSNIAWLAVLRGTRYANGVNFVYLNVSTSTGTDGDTSTRNLSPAPADAAFFRFPQSAQETYEADDPALMDVGGTDVLSTYAASNTATGAAPTEYSAANTHLFRRGLRVLTAAESVAFASAIASRVLEKHNESGPFRSTEEFLAPRALYADAGGRDRSLLEAAIEGAGLNAGIAEFSSQWLTPADVMTALAPLIFARSDTFIIRAYGEAVNPARLNPNGAVPPDAVEGRAWCEALVQRVPEYFDKSQPEETAPAELSPLNQNHGRRFRVVSFRWLTRGDI